MLVLAGLAALVCSTAVADEAVRIVCFGDSVTKAVRPGVEPHETFGAVLEQTLNDAGRTVRVFNAGVGGNTTTQGLARLQRDVLDRKPHYVVVMFGLNDSWVDSGRSESRVSIDDYRANLRTMIAQLRGQGASTVLMTPNPAIAPKYPPHRNVTLKGYVEAVRDVARAELVPLVDVYRRFAELGIEGADLNALFTDAMHPNPAGQRMIAEMLSARFDGLLAEREHALAACATTALPGAPFCASRRFVGHRIGRRRAGWSRR